MSRLLSESDEDDDKAVLDNLDAALRAQPRYGMARQRVAWFVCFVFGAAAGAIVMALVWSASSVLLPTDASGSAASTSMAATTTLAAATTATATATTATATAATATATSTSRNAQRLIMLSLDGWRHDLLTRRNASGAPLAPNLLAHALRGVAVRRTVPPFPSSTFPGHYTLATGRYPARHGIVQNAFLDPVHGRFHMGLTQGYWFDEAESIWISAERQGVHAAAFTWVGSESTINGTHATFFTRFNDRLSNRELIDSLLVQLDKPYEPRLFVIYFPDIDSAEHKHGVLSPEADAALAKVDGDFAYMMAALSRRDDFDSTLNVAVMSDHGHSNITAFVPLSDYPVAIETELYLLSAGSLGQIFPRDDEHCVPSPCARSADERIVEAYNNLTAALGDPGTAPFWPYLTQVPPSDPRAPPARYHYQGNARLAPLILDAKPRMFLQRQPHNGPAPVVSGHGWDPDDADMQTAFIAAGPVFKNPPRDDRELPERVFTTPVLNSTDVYELACAILGITPADNDGDFERVVKGFLRDGGRR